MNLKYKILWVENDEDWVESIEDSIEDFVEGLGFIYEKELLKRREENINYNEYDLILMDLNLADAPTGDKIIQEIRTKGIYTDVIFYTAGGVDSIKAKIDSLALEGVYYSDRGKDIFVGKVQKIISTTIKKVQDLNNLRGLVMAEVSELDSIMDAILADYYNTPERMEVFHKHITKDKEKSLRKSLNCKNSCNLYWRDKDINYLIKTIDSSQKAHAINQIIVDNPSLHIVFNPNEKSFLDSYLNQIVTTRNHLAHCESVIENGKEILKTRQGDIEFSSDDFIEIRKNITIYHNIFNKISEWLH